MVAKFLNWIGDFFSNLFGSLLGFLSDIFGWLLKGIIEFLKFLFKPILILVAIVFYLIYKLGVLVVLLIKVLLAIGKLLYSFVIGLFKTLAGLVWVPTNPDHGAWSDPIRQTFVGLAPYQLDKIAYVLLFVIWIMTAFGAIRILTGGGGGGGE